MNTKEKIFIKESGMKFGEFDTEKVFQIEKSEIYLSIGDDIKSVEFLYLQSDDRLCFVEAKSSSPKADNDVKFNVFIKDISDKFIHSFELWLSIVSGRREVDISEYMKKPDMKKIKFKFILVINGHKTEWLVPIMSALKKIMVPYNRIWGSEVIVLNENEAKRFNLLCD